MQRKLITFIAVLTCCILFAGWILAVGEFFGRDCNPKKIDVTRFPGCVVAAVPTGYLFVEGWNFVLSVLAGNRDVDDKLQE